MDDPVDGGGGGEELRLLKKRLHYGRMSNSGRCVVSLGMELWNGMGHHHRGPPSVGKSNDCDLEIDLHIYGASR